MTKHGDGEEMVLGAGDDGERRDVLGDDDAHGEDEPAEALDPLRSVNTGPRTCPFEKYVQTAWVERHMIMHTARRRSKNGAFCDRVVEQVAGDLLRLGVHGDVVLKSDQESARGLKADHPETVSCGDSGGNGMTERAIQSIEHFFRTHRMYLESNVKQRISPNLCRCL